MFVFNCALFVVCCWYATLAPRPTMRAERRRAQYQRSLLHGHVDEGASVQSYFEPTFADHIRVGHLLRTITAHDATVLRIQPQTVSIKFQMGQRSNHPRQTESHRHQVCRPRNASVEDASSTRPAGTASRGEPLAVISQTRPKKKDCFKQYL